jgi:hypothetical protein
MEEKWMLGSEMQDICKLSCLVLSGIFCYKSRYKHPPSQTPVTPCLSLRYAFCESSPIN